MAEEAAKTETTDDASSAGAAASSGGPSKLVMILTIVNLVITLGVAGALFVSFKKEKTAPKVEDISTHTPTSDEKPKEGEKTPPKAAIDFGKMITLDQFTVNLSTPGTVVPKFARVNIAIEVTNADAEAEVTQKMPQVRNAIIDLFNSKRHSDLSTTEGREYLKEEIRNALNSFMVSGKIRGVFFTNFAVSS